MRNNTRKQYAVNPTELAEQITGCKKSDSFEGCSNSHGYNVVLGWPCPFLINASELIRYALTEAWEDGNIWGWSDGGEANYCGIDGDEIHTNPYEKG